MHDKITSILLIGPPAIGKTTVVQKLVNALQKNNIKYAGFYTQEVRIGVGSRIGFDVLTLDGKRGTLARRSSADNIERPRIGNYFVFVKEFDDLAIPALKAEPETVVIIDEVGKMELLSEKFKHRIKELYGKAPILATIPQSKRGQIDIIDELKAEEGSVVIEITKKNRNSIADSLCEMVRLMIAEYK